MKDKTQRLGVEPKIACYHSFIKEYNALSYEELLLEFNEYSAEEYMAELGELATKIADAGDAGEEYLLNALLSADMHHTRAILESFPWFREHESDVKAALLRYFDDDRPLILFTVISSMAAIRFFDKSADIYKLRKHENHFVAGIALEFLGKCFGDDAKPTLVEALASDDYIVLQFAIDTLYDIYAFEEIPSVAPFMNHPHADVRQAATTFVENMTELKDEQES